MLLEGVGDEKQLVLEAERAGVRDPLDEEVARVLEWGQPLGKGARRGRVPRAGRPTAEEVVWPLVVVQRPKPIEGALLRSEIGSRRATGPGFQGPVHAFVRPVLLGRGGVNALMLDAEALHQTLSCERPWMPHDAKGTPLSVRIARGRPNSRKVRSKTGRAPRPLMLGNPRHASR